ncbi:MAG: PA2779 family protein [Pseudohongiellaceae bacterium]
MRIDRLFHTMGKQMLLVVALLFGWQSFVAADVVTSEQLLAESRVQQQQAEVSTFLARDGVRQQLMAHGVDADSAMERVNALSAEELSMLHAQIDQLPAGEGVLESVLFLLVIFMLLDIAGVTDIFPGL